MFERPVAVLWKKDDAGGYVRAGTVLATVVIGSGMSAGAGAMIHSETADRVSVVIRRCEWNEAFNFAPRFGMKFEDVQVGTLDVKGVTVGEREFTCRCTQNARARER